MIASRATKLRLGFARGSSCVGFPSKDTTPVCLTQGEANLWFRQRPLSWFGMQCASLSAPLPSLQPSLGYLSNFVCTSCILTCLWRTQQLWFIHFVVIRHPLPREPYLKRRSNHVPLIIRDGQFSFVRTHSSLANPRFHVVCHRSFAIIHLYNLSIVTPN